MDHFPTTLLSRSVYLLAILFCHSGSSAPYFIQGYGKIYKVDPRNQCHLGLLDRCIFLTDVLATVGGSQSDRLWLLALGRCCGNVVKVRGMNHLIVICRQTGSSLQPPESRAARERVPGQMGPPECKQHRGRATKGAVPLGAGS